MAPTIFQLLDLGQIFGGDPPKSSIVDLIIILTYVYNSPAYKLPFCLLNWAAPLFITCMTDSFGSYAHLNRHFFIFLDIYLSFSEVDYSQIEELFTSRDEVSLLLTQIYTNATDQQIMNQLKAIRGLAGSRSRCLQLALTSNGLHEFLIDCSICSYAERTKVIIEILEYLLDIQQWVNDLTSGSQTLLEMVFACVLGGGLMSEVGMRFLGKMLVSNMGKTTSLYMIRKGHILRDLLRTIRPDWPGKQLLDVLNFSKLFSEFGQRMIGIACDNNLILQAIGKDKEACNAIESIIDSGDEIMSQKWSQFYGMIVDQKHERDMDVEDEWECSDF